MVRCYLHLSSLGLLDNESAVRCELSPELAALSRGQQDPVWPYAWPIGGRLNVKVLIWFCSRRAFLSVADPHLLCQAVNAIVYDRILSLQKQ